MIKILDEYIADRNLPELKDTPDNALPSLLESFYTDVCTQAGKCYHLQSLKCICAGINRYLKDTRNIDIISDLRFTKTNQMFSGVTKQTRKEGHGSTKSYPIIEDKDMTKLGEYFKQDFGHNPVNAKKLQQAVIFSLMYFICRRG